MALTELTKVTGPGIHTLSNVLSHNIKSSGIITATKFSGPLDSIGGNFAGVITATSANFTGNVSIGGTLTYEDVTNIDSVGIITARDGLKVLGGGANIVGVVTATTFKGDGDFVELDVDGHTNLDNVSIAGVTTTTDHIYIDADNKKLNIGDSSDLQLYHTGSRSEIINNTGDLIVQPGASSNLFLRSQTGAAHFKGVHAAQVELYWNGNKRLETSSVGVSITQDLDVDGHTNLDNVSIAGVTTISDALHIESTQPRIYLTDTNHNSDWSIRNSDGTIYFYDETLTNTRFEIYPGNSPTTRPFIATPFTTDCRFDGFVRIGAVGNSPNHSLTVGGNSNFSGISSFIDIDVDGHTNLDNVSIAGVTTFAAAPVIPSVAGSNINADLPVLYRTSTGAIDGGSGLNWNPAEDSMKIGGTGSGGLNLSSQTVRGSGASLTLTTQNNNGNCDIHLTDIIKFDTGGSERVRITSTGLVGIGTDNPLQRLHVKQGSTTTPAMVEALGAQSHVKFQHNAGSSYTTTIGSKTLGAGNVGLTFNTGTSGGGTKMTIDVNGKVGIGTELPQTMHHLYGSSGLYTRFESAQGQVNFGNSNGAGVIHVTSTSQPLRFLVNGSNERLRIFSNGSVGVGDYSSTNLTHAFQALRTSGSTYVSSKNTGGNALFYAEASNGNTAKLELMQAGTGNFTLEVGSTNALMFKDDGTERLRIESGGTLFSKSPSDATPNFKFISDDTNWHGYLNQTVHGSTISTILSCGGTWTVDGVTYAATKDYNGSFGTAALIVHNQYSGTATGGELVFVTKANGSSTTDGAVTERFRIKSDGTVNCLGTAALTVPVGTTAQRPSSLATGMMRYNSTTTQLELYGGNGWFNVMDGIGQVGTASNPAESGKQLKDLGRSSGNYYIKPKGYSGSAIEAYVDMTTNGGGWVLVASFALSHSGLTMSGNTSGLNESSVKNYAATVPSNNSSAFYNKNFINYLFHQNATNDSNSTYSIAGVHGRSGNGYILWEIKAQSTHTNSSTDAFTTIYKTSDANNNFDVRYVTNSSNTLNYYVGTSSGEFNSYANYNDGRGGTSDGGNNYHYLIDDITGGYEWAFRENSDDNPGANNGYNLSNIFIR